MKRTTFLIILTAGTLLVAQTQHSRISGTARPSRFIQVPDGTSNASVEVRQVDILFDPGSGPRHRGAIILLYEPTSQRYWWTIEGTQPDDYADLADGFLKGNRIYDHSGRLAVFGYHDQTLTVREDSGQAADITDAQQKAMEGLDREWDSVNSDPWWGVHAIKLVPVLGKSFVFLKDSAFKLPGPTVESVTRPDDYWVVALNGPNGDGAEVALDNSFQVLRHSVGPRTAQ